MKRIDLWLALLASLLLLAACSGGKETAALQPTTTQLGTATEAITAIPANPAYPYPAAAPAQLVNPANPVYPYPTQVQPSAPASPDQATAYPGAGQEPSLAPTQSVGDPTATSPYPGPGLPAYPGPTQVASLAPTLDAPPVPLETQPPAPTLRPTRDIQKELHATDPTTVQLASGKVQLVEFFAFWDGTSKAMAPTVHGLEAEYEQRMNFVYLDIDDPAIKNFKGQLGYRYQPHLFLLDERGSILKQWLGYVEEADLRAAFEAALQ